MGAAAALYLHGGSSSPLPSWGQQQPSTLLEAAAALYRHEWVVMAEVLPPEGEDITASVLHGAHSGTRSLTSPAPPCPPLLQGGAPPPSPFTSAVPHLSPFG
jgi:hypothetical protein